MVEVPLLSFPFMNVASCPNESPYSGVTPLSCWTRTGELFCLLYNALRNGKLIGLRNPFNDDLIASGSDDGKVRVPEQEDREIG